MNRADQRLLELSSLPIAELQNRLIQANTKLLQKWSGVANAFSDGIDGVVISELQPEVEEIQDYVTVITTAADRTAAVNPVQDGIPRQIGTLPNGQKVVLVIPHPAR